MALVIAILALFGFAVDNYMKRMIAEDLGKGAEAVAVVVAKVVEPRLSEYRTIRSEADQAAPFYREMREMFSAMKSDDFIKYIYTERRVSEAEIEYVLDSEDTGSESASPPGSRDAMNALRERAYGERKPVHGSLVDDPVWGRLISGCAPIFDPRSGEFEGLACVDIKADTVYALFARIGGVVALLIALLAAASAGPAFTLADSLARQVMVDPTTGAYSPRRLALDADRSLRAARNQDPDRPPAILILDIDRFKDMNDSYGRELSDRFLGSLARHLRGCLGWREALYRSEGDKFAVLLPKASKELALRRAESLRSRAAAHFLDLEGGRTLSATVSVGIARWSRGTGVEELIGRADDAMYASKKFGRNRVTDYEDYEAEKVRTRREQTFKGSP